MRVPGRRFLLCRKSPQRSTSSSDSRTSRRRRRRLRRRRRRRRSSGRRSPSRARRLRSENAGVPLPRNPQREASRSKSINFGEFLERQRRDTSSRAVRKAKNDADAFPYAPTLCEASLRMSPARVAAGESPPPSPPTETRAGTSGARAGASLSWRGRRARPRGPRALGPRGIRPPDSGYPENSSKFSFRRQIELVPRVSWDRPV